MLSISICDDTPQDLEKLISLLQGYLQEHDLQAQVEGFSHPDALLQQANTFDLYLLDVVMPMYTGIDLGRVLRERGYKGPIVYFTSSDAFALESFEVKAAHYILKPYTPEQFTDALDRALRQIPQKPPKLLHLKTEDGAPYSLDIEDIRYGEGRGHFIVLHTKARDIVVKYSLSGLLEELEVLAPKQFISPYKGYLVNQRAIVSIRKDGIGLAGGAQIPIPKRNFKQLQDIYMDFLFQRGED